MSFFKINRILRNTLLFSFRVPQLPVRACTTNLSPFEEKYEPPYLHDKSPRIETHELVNVQIKGYDYAVLQSFQSWASSTLLRLGLDVCDTWAVPRQSLKVSRFNLRQKNIVDEYYQVDIFERIIQIRNLPSTKVPLMVELLQAALPEGVELLIDNHTQLHSEVRYIPMKELKELQKELEAVSQGDQLDSKNRFRRKK